MSGLVNPGSNPYLQNPEFLQQLQNQYYQNRSQLVNQTPLNFYQVNQIMQPNYFAYQSQNFQLPMQTSFQQNSNFQQPPTQTYYQNQEDGNLPWASNGFQCQQGVSSPTQSVSSSIVQLDQSLLSPSLQDTSGFSNQSSIMSPHSLQYQWEGLNTQRASSTYPDPSKTIVQHTQLQMDDMLCKSPVSSSQAERYVVREVKYSMTDDCPDQELVIQLDEKPDTNPEEEQNIISNYQTDSWKDVLQTVGLDFQELPDIKDEDLKLTLPLANPLNISPEPNKTSSISASADVFEDDFDDDFDKGVAFPAGSAEQTRALGSSQFMKKMRKFVDHLKATRGHLLTHPVVKQETEMPELRKMAQPKRRELKRDLNQGVVPGIFCFHFLLVEQLKYEITVS